MDGDHADDLLRRALIDAEASASVALRVTPLTLSEALTVVFHGRRDLGTLQTYVAHGGRGAGDAVNKDALLRVPLTSTSPPRRTARRPSACSPSRPPRCATRWSAPTPCSTSGASRWRMVARQGARRPPDPDRRAPARAPADADRAGGAGEADRRHRRVRRPAARRGPPADGHRLRASRTSSASIRCRTTRSAAWRTS